MDERTKSIQEIEAKISQMKNKITEAKIIPNEHTRNGYIRIINEKIIELQEELKKLGGENNKTIQVTSSNNSSNQTNNEFYILHNIYAYTGRKGVNVPYTNYDSLIMNVWFPTYIPKYFSEYSKIEEPMIFDQNMKEYFTGITIGRKILENINPNSSEGTKKNGEWKYWINDFEISRYASPNTYLMYNDTCSYPFVRNFGSSYDNEMHEYYQKLNGTELNNLLKKICDNQYASTFSFDRHKRVLLTIFKNSCVLAELPYKTPEEYDAYIKKLEYNKQYKMQQTQQAQLTEQQDGEAARRILDNYKK